MYVAGNVEARSSNNCCSGKVTVIAYSKCVFVALVIQHAKRVRPICGLSGCTEFFPRYLANGTIFGKNLMELQMCILIFSEMFF
jgi:hypothetical protein